MLGDVDGTFDFRETLLWSFCTVLDSSREIVAFLVLGVVFEAKEVEVFEILYSFDCSKDFSSLWGILFLSFLLAALFLLPENFGVEVEVFGDPSATVYFFFGVLISKLASFELVEEPFRLSFPSDSFFGFVKSIISSKFA